MDCRDSALCLETSVADSVACLLFKTEIASSHLAERADFFGSQGRRTTMGQWDVFEFLDACVNQIGQEDTSQGSEQWQVLWDLFCSSVQMLRGWSGDPSTTAQVGKVLVASAFVMRRFYKLGVPQAPSEVATGFRICAKALPFSLQPDLSLQDQYQLIVRNLEWLHTQIK